MSYNYLVETALSNSAAYAAVQQTLNWMDRDLPWRMEYLGGLFQGSDFLVTGLWEKVDTSVKMEELLNCYFTYAPNKGYPLYIELPIRGYSSLTNTAVKEIFKGLEGKVDTLDIICDHLSPDDEEKFLNNVKRLYYDCHLEKLLDSNFAQEHMKHIGGDVNASLPEELASVLKTKKEKFTAKASVLGKKPEIDYIQERWEGNQAIFGKYHSTVCPVNPIFPYYTTGIPGIETVICDYAFDGCEDLKSIAIPDGITYFGKGVFRGCTSLENIGLNSDLKELPSNTFENCTALQKIVLPEGIERIGENAFKGCTNLKTLTLPASITAVDELGCGMDTVIICDEGTYIHRTSVEKGWTVQLR